MENINQYLQPVFFKPNTELIKWLIEYAKNRIIIDAGSGAKFPLSQQLILNGYKKVLAFDSFIDYNEFMKFKMLHGDILSEASFHVFPKEIQSMSELYNDSATIQKVLIVFARPCHSNFVEETLDLKGKDVEVLYITVPKNIKEYDDLGKWKKKKKLLKHKGSSADKEVIYSII